MLNFFWSVFMNDRAMGSLSVVTINKSYRYQSVMYDIGVLIICIIRVMRPFRVSRKTGMDENGLE